MASRTSGSTTSRATLLAKQIKRDWWWITIGLVILSGLLSIFNKELGLERLNLTFYDFQSSLASSPPTTPNTALIVIDDKSIEQLGYWPWRRIEYAHLLKHVEQAKAVGLDIVFFEHNPAYPNDDYFLAYAINNHGRVTLANVINAEKNNVQQPLEPLAKAAAAIGYINAYPDSDGVIRRTHLYMDLPKSKEQHFTLALLEAAGESPKRQDILDHNQSVFLIPFLGPPGTFDIYSFSDVLDGKIPPSTFKDRYVLVGAWSSGFGDFYPTPLSNSIQPSMSGVEILANSLENVQKNHWIQLPPSSLRVLLSVLPIIFICIVLRHLTPRRAIIGTASVLSVVVIGNWLLLHLFYIWVPPSAALIGTMLSYPVWYWRSQETVLRHINNEIIEMRNQDPALRQSLKGNSISNSSLPVRLSYLHKAIELLREAQQQREETLRFISHDMRAPQNSILALVKMRRDKELHLDTDKILNKVESYASTTLSLVDDFMDLARVEAMEIEFDSVYLNDLLAEVCDDAWIRAQAKQITVIFNEPEDGIWVQGSNTLLKRALINLVDNAIKYSSENTTVHCELMQIADQATIIIKDEGWGIPAEHIDTIFQPFKRAHTQQANGPTGSGLGLAFVHTVIMRHLGDIQVRSVCNIGTTFTVSLPILPESD